MKHCFQIDEIENLFLRYQNGGCIGDMIQVHLTTTSSTKPVPMAKRNRWRHSISVQISDKSSAYDLSSRLYEQMWSRVASPRRTLDSTYAWDMRYDRGVHGLEVYLNFDFSVSEPSEGPNEKLCPGWQITWLVSGNHPEECHTDRAGDIGRSCANNQGDKGTISCLRYLQ